MTDKRNKRKTSRPRSDNRNKILAAATRLIGVHGFACTSIQAVADAVGIRKQSLLHHFTNKENLREAVLGSLLSYFREVIPQALVKATTGEGRFESAINVMIDFFLEDQSRAQIVVREVLDQPERMHKGLTNHLKPWLGLITDYIRKGQQEGLIYEDVDPEAYVMQVVILSICIIVGAKVFSAIFPAEESFDVSFKRMITEIQRSTKVALFTNKYLKRRQQKSRLRAQREASQTAEGTCSPETGDLKDDVPRGPSKGRRNG
jgi:AcrR family transcriptional regulator